LERAVWVKPPDHTKQKHTEHLPLAKAVVALLEKVLEFQRRGANFVFPAKSKVKALVDLKKFKKPVIAAADIFDYRIHDNRHTHVSQLVTSGMKHRKSLRHRRAGKHHSNE
jgi:hypothetical protein